MSSWFGRKKRKIDDQGGTVGGGGGGESVAAVNEEATLTLTKTMTEVVNQSRDMLQMMQSMQEEMKNMQNTMKNIQSKQIRVENSNSQSMRDVKKKLNTNHMKFLDMDEKLKYHEVLLKNQKWEYSASRPLYDGYWDNLDEDEDEAAEEFLEQVEKYTKAMRYGHGISDGEIDVSLDTSVSYNEVLLPHWKEFANALEQYQYHLNSVPNIKSIIRFNDMELSDEVVNLLSKALKSTHFRHVLFQDNNFGEKGIDFALKYLKGNDMCKEFSMKENEMGMNDIKKLCGIIPFHSTLSIVKIRDCVGEDIDGYGILKSILSAGNKLVNICLSSNGISTSGDTFISDFLSSNHTLAVLRVTNNELDDNDAVMIASALKRNKTLRLLEIAGNNLTSAGWEALSKAVYDDTSLNSLALSNHTCHVDFPSAGFEKVREMNGIEGGERYAWYSSTGVRRKKIYSILSSRNRTENCSNTGHFSDIPFELLPRMLRSIQSYSNYYSPHRPPQQDNRDVKPLSLVYEICRHWDESLAVYEVVNSRGKSYEELRLEYYMTTGLVAGD